MLLSHLEYLVAVKKYGSMNKAAAALFCAQPTISNAFQTLEKELGNKIVKRTPSGIEFTEFGEQMVSDAQVILGIVDGWKTMSKTDPMELKISYSIRLERLPLMDLLMEFQRLFPETKYQMIPSIKNGVEIFQPGDGLVCHFGFFVNTPTELEKTKIAAAQLGLQIAKIDNGRFDLCFSTQNPLAKKDHISMKDLAGMEIVLRDSSSEKGGIIGFPYIHHLLDIGCKCTNAMGDHNNIMLSLVNNPNIITFRPNRMLLNDPYVTNRLVAVRQVEDCTMEINLYMFYPDLNRLNMQERRFIEYIRSHAKLFEQIPL